MVQQDRQQQEPTEAAQGRLNAAPERRRNPLPSGRGGCQNQAIDGIEIGLGIRACGEAAYTGQRVIVESVHEHPNWHGYTTLAEQAGEVVGNSIPLHWRQQQCLLTTKTPSFIGIRVDKTDFLG